MSEWKTVRLGDYITEYSVKNKSNEDIPVYSVTNTQGFCTEYFSKDVSSKDKSNYKIVPRGCFAYNPSRINVGSVDWQRYEDRVIVSPLYTVFKVSPELENQYLYYFLKSDIGHTLITSKAEGSVRDNLKITMLAEFSIPLPPLEEQKHIATMLDKCTALVTKYKLMLEKYDTLIKSRFIEMFGDPVSNPMGWEVKKLGNICSKISDGVHAKPEYTSTGKPFISVVNINSGKLLFDDCKYVSEEAYEKMIKSTHPEKGDVLYTKVGATYGIPALVDTDKDFCLYVSVALLKPKSEIVNSQFLTISMAQPYIKNQADKRIKGIGVPDLHLNQIREFDILLPPLELQKQFAAFVQQIDKSKFTVQKSLEKAETLYKSLMQQYFA